MARGTPCSSRHDLDDNSSETSNTSSYPSYYTPSLARRMQRTNQEARQNSSTNQDSPYNQYLPPRDTYSTLPSRRPISRTGSFKSNDNKPKNHLPPSSVNYVDARRSTDSLRRNYSDRSGSTERYMPQYGNGLENGNDSRRSSHAESKDQFGSTDSLNYSGYGRERSAKDSNGYLPPTRRTIGMLNDQNGSLPRRHQYRSSMSDTLDYARPNASQLSSDVNNYDHETLPPLPSVFGRKRDNSVQRSSSYLRQRAIDIANIYGAPLPYQEPTRLERDADVRGSSCDYDSGQNDNVNRYDDKVINKYGDKMSEFQGDRSRRSGSVQPMSRFRAGSLTREGSERESVAQSIIRRQKSFDKLDQGDGGRNSQLRRPMSLDLRSTPDRSVLGKFLRDDEGRLVESEDGGLLRVGDQAPVSPLKSPGRKVSRFLRPDFYDTPREDSAFAKEKEEAEKGSAAGKSKKENIASFLELNYADLERNIAKDLLAISENAIRQKSDVERYAGKSGEETNSASVAEEKEISKDFNVDRVPRSVAASPIVKKEITKATTELKSPLESAAITVDQNSVQDEYKPVQSQIKIKPVVVEEKSVLPPENNVKDSPKEVEVTNKLKVKKKVKKVDESEAKPAADVPGVSINITKIKKMAAATESASTNSVSNKNKFLRSLDKTIDKFKSSDSEPRETKSRIKNVIRSLRESSLTPTGSDAVLTETSHVKRAVSVDNCSEQADIDKSSNKIKKVIKSLKELTSNPKTNLDTESNLIKRATSVDDLSNPCQTKSNQVNSVLGMFRKMEEPKAEKKASLLSRFRRTQSVYSGSSSDGVLATGGVEARSKRISLGPDSMTGEVGKTPVKKLERPLSENLDKDMDVDRNVSCSIKIKAPKKEVAKLDGLENGIAKNDVSISETVKVVKVVEKEKIPSNDLSNPETEVVKPASKIPQKGPVRILNGDSDRADKTLPRDALAYPGSSRPERREPRIKYHEPLSSSSVLSEDESESLDSCSVGSGSRTTSPLPPRAGAAEVAESIEDRIRRKSFYSRFNDCKKKAAPARKTSVTGIPTLKESMAPRKSSSFVSYTNESGRQ